MAGPLKVEADRLTDMLLEQNPHSRRSEVAAIARSAVRLTRVVSRLSHEQRRRLDEASFEDKALQALATALDGEDRPIPSFEVTGEGLGRRVEPEDGVRRLQVLAEPISLEAWAGPTAGATTLERKFGIPRSTLQAWRRQNAVIGLLKGVKREVFPLRQFVDGRPVQGIAAVAETIAAPRVAWFWLISPHPELSGRSPMDVLEQGRAAEVATLAKADYDQP
jgi:transposase-like protein